MDRYSSFFMFGFSLRFIPCMNRSAPTIQSQTNPIHSYFLVAFSGNKHQINTKRDIEQKQSPEKVSNQATFRGLPLVRETGLESDETPFVSFRSRVKL